MKKKVNAPELEYIRHCVEMVFGLSLYRKSRKTYYVRARWVFFKLAKQTTNYRIYEIAGFINKDHATILHGLKNFDRDILGVQEYAEKYNHCVKMLKGAKVPSYSYKPERVRALLNSNINLRKEFEDYKLRQQKKLSELEPLFDIYYELPRHERARLMSNAKTMLKVYKTMNQ